MLESFSDISGHFRIFANYESSTHRFFPLHGLEKPDRCAAGSSRNYWSWLRRIAARAALQRAEICRDWFRHRSAQNRYPGERRHLHFPHYARGDWGGQGERLPGHGRLFADHRHGCHHHLRPHAAQRVPRARSQLHHQHGPRGCALFARWPDCYPREHNLPWHHRRSPDSDSRTRKQGGAESFASRRSRGQRNMGGVLARTRGSRQHPGGSPRYPESDWGTRSAGQRDRGRALWVDFPPHRSRLRRPPPRR